MRNETSMYVVESECIHLNTSGTIKPFTKAPSETSRDQWPWPSGLRNRQWCQDPVLAVVGEEGGKCTNAFQSISQRTVQSQVPLACDGVRKCRIVS